MDVEASKFQLIGTATSLVFYGINVCLFVQLSTTFKRARHWTTATTLISFLLTTTFEVLFSCVTFAGIVHPEEPESIDAGHLWLALQTAGLIATWVLDSFVLFHQCFTIYSLYKKGLWAIGIACLFFMSSLGSGIYLLVWAKDWGIQVLPHFPLCLTTKFILTSLIVVKLLQHRRMMNNNFDSESGKHLTRPYTALAQVLVQSYALYASFSSMFLGLYIAKHEAWRLVIPNAVQAGLLSHLLVRSSVIRSTRNDPSYHSEKDMTPICFSDSNTTETAA